MNVVEVRKLCFFGGVVRFGGGNSGVRGKFFEFGDLCFRDDGRNRGVIGGFFGFGDFGFRDFCFGDDARHEWYVRRGATAARLILEELTFHARLDGPVTPFARIILGSLFLHERFVQTQVVPDAVLPPCFGDAVVGKGVGYPFVYRGERQAAVRSA